MAAAYVKSGANIDFGATTVAVTITSVTAASALVAFSSWLSTTITLSSITDSKSQTYTLLDNPTTNTGNGRAASGYTLNVGAGNTTITMTLSAGVTAELHVLEFSGLATSTAEDGHTAQAQSNPGTGANAETSGAIVTTVAGDAVAACTFDLSNTDAASAVGTGYTIAATGTFGKSEYQIQAAAGSIAGTFTEDDASSQNITLVLALKAAGGGGASVVPVLMRQYRQRRSC